MPNSAAKNNGRPSAVAATLVALPSLGVGLTGCAIWATAQAALVRHHLQGEHGAAVITILVLWAAATLLASLTGYLVSRGARLSSVLFVTVALTLALAVLPAFVAFDSARKMVEQFAVSFHNTPPEALASLLSSVIERVFFFRFLGSWGSAVSLASAAVGISLAVFVGRAPESASRIPARRSAIHAELAAMVTLGSVAAFVIAIHAVQTQRAFVRSVAAAPPERSTLLLVELEKAVPLHQLSTGHFWLLLVPITALGFWTIKQNGAGAARVGTFGLALTIGLLPIVFMRKLDDRTRDVVSTLEIPFLQALSLESRTSFLPAKIEGRAVDDLDALWIPRHIAAEQGPAQRSTSSELIDAWKVAGERNTTVRIAIDVRTPGHELQEIVKLATEAGIQTLEFAGRSGAMLSDAQRAEVLDRAPLYVPMAALWANSLSSVSSSLATEANIKRFVALEDVNEARLTPSEVVFTGATEFRALIANTNAEGDGNGNGNGDGDRDRGGGGGGDTAADTDAENFSACERSKRGEAVWKTFDEATNLQSLVDGLACLLRSHDEVILSVRPSPLQSEGAVDDYRTLAVAQNQARSKSRRRLADDGDGRSDDAFYQVVSRNRSRFRYCFEKEVSKQPNLGGKVVVRVEIDLRGEVTSARVEESTVRSPSIELCLLRTMRVLSFPSSHRGRTRVVQFPFFFSSNPDTERL